MCPSVVNTRTAVERELASQQKKNNQAADTSSLEL